VTPGQVQESITVNAEASLLKVDTAQISTTVDTDWQWLPFMEFAYSSGNDTFGAAVAAKGDLSAGLDAWQAALVDYAKQQGFTVNG